MSETKAHASNLCGAKTRAGTLCKNYAMPNGRCRMHGGKSTGPKDKKKQAKSQQNNKNAEKHGLFSRYLPEETMDLVNSMDSLNTIDMIWDNIKIQYAAIIRSQKIMYVKDKEEMIKELKKRKFEVRSIDGEHTPILSEEECEFQFAWDRQATYLQAQSRAMAELRNMISKYDEMCKSDMATEEQKERIRKLKAETNKLESDNTEQAPPVINIIDAWTDRDE